MMNHLKRKMLHNAIIQLHYPASILTSIFNCGGVDYPSLFHNYQIFVTKQEIGEKKRIKEIGLRWDINPCVSQMYF